MKRPIVFLLALISFCGPSAFALYDAAPDLALSAAQGEWRGTLTYRDYEKPDRIVTLPTRLFVALAAPQQMVLFYAFDDGPAKTVFSYEAMTIKQSAKQLIWTTGADKKETSTLDITSSTPAGKESRRLVFTKTEGAKTDRYTMKVGAHKLSLRKDEVASDGSVTNRNQFTFERP